MLGTKNVLNVKTLSFFSFKISMKFNNKPNIMKKSKYQQYFDCFIVCILVPYAFGLATSRI